MKQIGYFVRLILISVCLSGVPETLAGSAQPSSSAAGNALLISDLHFDPLCRSRWLAIRIWMISVFSARTVAHHRSRFG
jgi:hypothetical protein